MKNNKEFKELSRSDEISSIIYALIATVKSSNHIKKRLDFDVVDFVIGSMYDLEFPIYKNLEFITRDGGARYILNDVSSYRLSKDFDTSTLFTLKRLFSKYGCKNKEEIIKFIKGICNNPNINLYDFDEIKKALMAYETYYKNGITISEWPDEQKLISDYKASKSTIKKNDIKTYNYVDIAHDNGTIAYSTPHAKNINSCLLFVANGITNVDEDSAAYMCYEMINEWYFNSNPYDDNFENELSNYIEYINKRIVEYLKENNQNSTASISLSIINEDKTYICSIGDTRVYIIKDNHIIRIVRKETYLDEEENSIISLPVDFALSIPSGFIGLDKYNSTKYNPDFKTINSKEIDGVLILTPDVYRGMPEEDIDIFVSTFEDSELLKMLSMYKEPEKTNGYALYKKKRNK